MKNISSHQRTLLTAVCILSIAVTFMVIAWFSGASANQDEQLSESQRQAFYTDLRGGLGSVQFATARTPDKETVANSVDSVTGFIHDRSGLELNESTRQRLAAMELQALSGESRRLTPDGFAEVLTAAAIKRLGALTDQEIDEIAAILSQGDGGVILRANGSGYFMHSQFVGHTNAMRDLARQGDESLRATVHTAVQTEVNGRIRVYSEALPEQFGEAPTGGMTPLQAVLLTYSVAADDLMGGTQDTLQLKMSVLQQTLEARGSTTTRTPDKAYGKNGYLFATPLHLIFDESTMAHLLDLIDERSRP